MGKLMIYGATGYTGRLASEHAKSIGLDFILAGRTTQKLQDLAYSLSLSYQTFDVHDSVAHVDSALKDIEVFLNCAGPFHRTAKPLMEACIRNGVHYLDIAAELESYERAEELGQEAKKAKVMLMPGCGGSVAMLGCLATHVLEQMDSSASSIDIALHVSGQMSRGSAISAQEGAMVTERQDIGGKMVHQDTASEQEFDFGDGRGRVMCFPIKLPDLITISKATGVSAVRTFAHVSGAAFPTGDLMELPSGPTAEEREANPYHAAVDITAEDETVRHAVLHTVNGYSFTSIASIEAAVQVLAGKFLPGFQTPVEVFGSGFVECIKGSTIANC
ncbi:hypothetical protein P152DRAFT_437997 [Eremomyces bilateralis CBS 781.70]|uniref:Saccharopine dehydrogenase NADP binding domain-containing protein n=1 Tax=Eremomyces bilateralis CBS 781.70 TaxID=1392243 RepID=A0A6G1G0T5_9PEZI|nr:uncharacterized protein P152DRAFT_437997 [Eremomyces bilateralis CBS 781.70]KAF1811541.1 hypothetical protein P152DRAFT_437997 [Eremomyces bilateralis CBS 781.70]